MYRKDYYSGWMKTYAYQQAEQNRLSYMERQASEKPAVGAGTD